MKKSLLLLPLALLALALALAACGGGGSSSSGGGGEAEAAIEETITESAKSTDPAKCTEIQTQAFNEQETASKGKEATENCESEAENGETEATTVNVSEVKVNGETATAVAEVDGTALTGQGIEIELLEEGGTWKMNKFVAFANYDANALAEALEKEFAKEEGVSPALAKCVSEGVSKFSQQEAEAVAFGGELEGIESLATSCNEETGGSEETE
jgi:hypothetical protein